MDDNERTGGEQKAGPAATGGDEIPVGDSPPRARWTVFLAVAAWGAWFIFLVAMAVYRIKTAAR